MCQMQLHIPVIPGLERLGRSQGVQSYSRLHSKTPVSKTNLKGKHYFLCIKMRTQILISF